MSGWKQFDPPKAWTIGDNLEVELFWRKRYPRGPIAGSPITDLRATMFRPDNTPMYCVEGSTESDADLLGLESTIRAKVNEVYQSGERQEKETLYIRVR